VPVIPPPEVGEHLYRFRRHPWAFFSTAVYTLDQADTWEPIKKYPTHLDYLKWTVEQLWVERLLAIVKHRRMVMTWTCCAMLLWDAMFHEGRFNVLLSKKEEDADELVRRCKFIYDQIPKEVMPVKPDVQLKYTELRFPEIDSVIKGFPQGADQLRQYTCSRIVADEMAFWPQARQSFVSMKPTIEGGGKIVLLSTRYPGFFREIIEDTVEAA
jgi:hypothetical protein